MLVLWYTIIATKIYTNGQIPIFYSLFTVHGCEGVLFSFGTEQDTGKADEEPAQQQGKSCFILFYILLFITTAVIF